MAQSVFICMMDRVNGSLCLVVERCCKPQTVGGITGGKDGLCCAWKPESSNRLVRTRREENRPSSQTLVTVSAQRQTPRGAAHLHRDDGAGPVAGGAHARVPEQALGAARARQAHGERRARRQVPPARGGPGVAKSVSKGVLNNLYVYAISKSILHPISSQKVSYTL